MENKMNSTLLIQLPKIPDKRGNLSFLEGSNHIPFEIKRAYWIYDVPGGEKRGGHAFIEQDEFIIAMSGSFDVIIDEGTGKKKKYSLNRSYFGLYVPHGTWRQMMNFSSNSLALVLASTYFNENDYIREYKLFKQNTKFETYIQSKKSTNNSIIKENIFSETTIDSCQILTFEKNHKEKGNLTVVENNQNIPFDIERVYYLYDVPGGEERGGHAHKDLYQLIIAASGAFDVEIDDGYSKKTITLNRPYQGLYIVPGIWRELKNFSSGSSCLVLASSKYDESDYLRDYLQFKELKK